MVYSCIVGKHRDDQPLCHAWVVSAETKSNGPKWKRESPLPISRLFINKQIYQEATQAMYDGNEFQFTLHRHALILSQNPEEVPGRSNCHSKPPYGISPYFPAPRPLAPYYNIIQCDDLMSGKFRIKGYAPQISPPISKVSSPSFISDDAFLSPPTIPSWNLSRVRNLTIQIWINARARNVPPAYWNSFKFGILSRMKSLRMLNIRVSTLPAYEGNWIFFSSTHYKRPRLPGSVKSLQPMMYEPFDAIPNLVEDVRIVSVETPPLPENIRRSLSWASQEQCAVREATRDVLGEELEKLHAAFKRCEDKPTTKTSIRKPGHMLTLCQSLSVCPDI
jgi:hypothetical protein